MRAISVLSLALCISLILFSSLIFPNDEEFAKTEIYKISKKISNKDYLNFNIDEIILNGIKNDEIIEISTNNDEISDFNTTKIASNQTNAKEKLNIFNLTKQTKQSYVSKIVDFNNDFFDFNTTKNEISTTLDMAEISQIRHLPIKDDNNLTIVLIGDSVM